MSLLLFGITWMLVRSRIRTERASKDLEEANKELEAFSSEAEIRYRTLVEQTPAITYVQEPIESNNPKVDFLPEELYSFVEEGWEQEDDITLFTLERSTSLS